LNFVIKITIKKGCGLFSKDRTECVTMGLVAMLKGEKGR
jgi:hypothetical protein